MTKKLWWIVGGGVILAGLWYLFKDKMGFGSASKSTGATKISSQVNTGTATTPSTATSTSAPTTDNSSTGSASTSSPSSGTSVNSSPWSLFTDKTLSSAADTVKTSLSSNSSLKDSVSSLFGGSSKSTGKQTPVTSGSGAGVPVDEEGTETNGGNDGSYDSAFDGSDSFDGYGD